MELSESFYPLFDNDCIREVFPWVRQLFVIRDEKGNICHVTGELEHNRIGQPPVHVIFTFPGSKPARVKQLVDTLEKWLPNELVVRVTDHDIMVLNS
jgi:hypothetical protein